MRPLLLLALLAALAAPANAGESGWTEIAPEVRLRLISSGVVEADGTTRLALEIAMPEHVKTYWRIPGETGIPTTIEIEGQGPAAIAWPFPTVDTAQGFLDYVYFGPTVLPFSVEAGAEEVTAHVRMGVCWDICVPAEASLSLRLATGSPDPGNALRIRSALAETPIPWDGDASAFGELVAGGGDALHLHVPGEMDAASVIVDSGEAGPLLGTPQKSPEPALWAIPVLGEGGAGALVGSSVRLTFMTPRGPYYVDRTVSNGSTDPAP